MDTQTHTRLVCRYTDIIHVQVSDVDQIIAVVGEHDSLIIVQTGIYLLRDILF